MARLGPAVAALALIAPLGLLASPPAHAQEKHGDDRVVVTGSVEVRSDEVVHDVIVIDGDVTVAGRVTGDLVAVAGDVNLTGRVEKDLITVAGRATLAEGARVEGDLVYGDEHPEIDPGATVDGEVRDEGWSDVIDAPWAVIGIFSLWLALSISLLVFGIALVAIAPRAAEAVNREARASPGLTVGVGVALLIGLPVLGVAALFTLVGIPLGIGVFLVLLPLAGLGYVTSSYLLGRAIVSDSTHAILAFLAGFGILRAVALIPLAGALIWLAAVVVGLGALLVAGLRHGGAGSASPA